MHGGGLWRRWGSAGRRLPARTLDGSPVTGPRSEVAIGQPIHAKNVKDNAG
jgi:hypothetical protein